MAAKSLERPILNPAFPSIKFFNGRLLTGEDLSAEQAANREGRRRLGEVIGEGIAYGLEVSLPEPTGPKPTVTVSAGVAVNRLGQTVVLANDEDLLLVPPPEGNQADSTLVGFARCVPPEAGVYVAGEGIYLLTIAPAFGGAGLAPVSGLGNTEAKCNRKYILEGATFRLIQLDFRRDLNLSNAELNNPNQLRNVVAYKCFGVEDVAAQSFLSNPFGPQVEKYGVLDNLRPNRLTDCEVPLALLHWKDGRDGKDKAGIKFIDLWAVRRRITKPSVSDSWNFVVGDRRRSEAEAMFLQFQAQIADLVQSGGLSAVAATQYFSFLPSVGILPVAASRSQSGFAMGKVFSGLTVRGPAFIEGAKLESLIRLSFTYPPIDLSSGELIWLYQVRENMEAVDYNPGNPPQAYLVFASGHMPYLADARFDTARWDYSNYALEQ